MPVLALPAGRRYCRHGAACVRGGGAGGRGGSEALGPGLPTLTCTPASGGRDGPQLARRGLGQGGPLARVRITPPRPAGRDVGWARGASLQTLQSAGRPTSGVVSHGESPAATGSGQTFKSDPVITRPNACSMRPGRTANPFLCRRKLRLQAPSQGIIAESIRDRDQCIVTALAHNSGRRRQSWVARRSGLRADWRPAAARYSGRPGGGMRREENRQLQDRRWTRAQMTFASVRIMRSRAGREALFQLGGEGEKRQRGSSGARM